MGGKFQRICTLVVMVGLSAAMAGAQDQGNSAAGPKTVQPSSPGTSKEKSLADVTRISTEDAARKAAQAEAKKKADAQEQSGEPSTMKSTGDVTELKPASKSGGDAGDAVILPGEKSGKFPLKNIHGKVYGTSGAENRQSGASVGASTKDNKAHIYVETNRSRSDTAKPH
jgi:hypothetical protein